MDPLTAAGTFATIVGLLSNFKAERSGARLDDFITWLKDQHQDQLARSIESNVALSSSLTSLLSVNHEELLARLKTLNDQIAVIGTRMEGFAEIVQILRPQTPLSMQARSVLKQIVESGARYVLEHKLSTGKPIDYMYIDGAIGSVNVEEPQFVAEDIDSLVAAGLLRIELTSKGNRKYMYTRAGAEYVRGDA